MKKKSLLFWIIAFLITLFIVLSGKVKVLADYSSLLLLLLFLESDQNVTIVV